MKDVIEILSAPPWTTHTVLAHFHNFESASRNVQATPDDGESGGGVPSMEVSFASDEDPNQWFHKYVRMNFENIFHGQTLLGQIMSVGEDEGIVSLSIHEIPQAFNYTFNFPPFVGTLDEMVDTFTKIVAGKRTYQLLEVEPSIRTKQVRLPSFNGNGWEWLNNICQAYQWEIIFDPQNDLPIIQKYRDPQYYSGYSVVTSPDIESITRNTETSSPAINVNVAYYTNEHLVGRVVYPRPEDPDNADPQILTVDAGETKEFEIKGAAHLISVNQPTAIDLVNPKEDFYDGTNGRYCVAGNDGVGIKAAQWAARGGSVKVRIKEGDPTTLVVTVRGMKDKTAAPYSIAATSDQGLYYNSLRITGEAVVAVEKIQRCPTGADPSLGNVEDGATVTNPAIATVAQARRIGVRLAEKYNGINMSIAATMDGINDKYADGPSAGGKTDPVPGLAYFDRENRYRITSVGYSNGGTPTAQMERRNYMSDFENVWTNADSMSDFEAEWAGKSMHEFTIFTMRR